MGGDILSIVEAAYAESTNADAWLEGALEAVHPHLDCGAGVLARSFQRSLDGLDHRHGSLRAIGVAADEVATIERNTQFIYELPPADAAGLVRRMFPLSPTVARMSQLIGASTTTQFISSVAPVGRSIADSLGVIAGDPTGHGCVFFRFEKKPVRLPPHDLALWRRIAAHLGTGYRLARGPQAAPDAVLTPSGKVLHLESDVPRQNAEPLTEATRAMDTARGRLRRTDPERALDLWRGLVSGRWSLVDHCDHDGRRYVFAKRNAPEIRPWQSLTEREAQVVAFVAEGQAHKLIGYQLGIAVSAVSESLLRAEKKLGVRCRADLIAAYRAASEDGEGS